MRCWTDTVRLRGPIRGDLFENQLTLLFGLFALVCGGGSSCRDSALSIKTDLGWDKTPAEVSDARQAQPDWQRMRCKLDDLPKSATVFCKNPKSLNPPHEHFYLWLWSFPRSRSAPRLNPLLKLFIFSEWNILVGVSVCFRMVSVQDVRAHHL